MKNCSFCKKDRSLFWYVIKCKHDYSQIDYSEWSIPDIPKEFKIVLCMVCFSGINPL